MKTNNHIILFPFGGLCNRINAITSTYYFAKNNGYKLSVYWRKNKDLSAKFTDLFTPTDFEDLVIYDANWRNQATYYFRSSLKLLPQKLKSMFNLKDLKYSNSLDNFKFSTGKNYFTTCHAIGEKSDLKNIFIPTNDIFNQINDTLKKFPNDIIGIHIRRTDHLRSINDCPIKDFHSKIKEEIKYNLNIKFYIASDDYKTKMEIKEKYGSRIISLNNELSRTSVSGMQDALIDLFLLSNTQKIIGSRYSTYSIIASELGCIKLEYAN